jgi:hypothetical protein
MLQVVSVCSTFQWGGSMPWLHGHEKNYSIQSDFEPEMRFVSDVVSVSLGRSVVGQQLSVGQASCPSLHILACSGYQVCACKTVSVGRQFVLGCGRCFLQGISTLGRGWCLPICSDMQNSVRQLCYQLFVVVGGWVGGCYC